MPSQAEHWIQTLELQRHPEGGWYRETYRSDQQVETPAGPRPASTAIYFLLGAGEASHFHRLSSDEIWHFYAGGPLTIHLLTESGYQQLPLGPEHLQAVVPAHTWFAAEPDTQTDSCLVGCTMAPGFDFADFELGNKTDLSALFPAQKALIDKLALDTRP